MCLTSGVLFSPCLMCFFTFVCFQNILQSLDSRVLLWCAGIACIPDFQHKVLLYCQTKVAADFLQTMKYQHFTGRHCLRLHLKHNDRHKKCALKTVAGPKSSLQLSNFLPSRLALFLLLLPSPCAVFAGFEIKFPIYNLSIIGTKLLNPFTIKSFQCLENLLARY